MSSDGPQAANDPTHRLATPTVTPSAPQAIGEAVGFGRALERLMTRFESLARRAARARGLPSDEVDDVLQDVRIRLWKSQRSSENLEGLGTSYLLRVVSSAVIDRLRQRRRQQETSLDVIMESVQLPAALHVTTPDVAEQQALATRLEQALMQLPQNRRLVVQLHLEGYERVEIAGMTGWTEAKVRNLLYRGLDDLRALLRAKDVTTDD